mmetsp:Transcript_3798/g.7251  ORF Transcript_3798/g.7251 Transcript_3798/m.7251 type:complete len:212 (-) Transcript_3798:740-1375(-)
MPRCSDLNVDNDIVRVLLTSHSPFGNTRHKISRSVFVKQLFELLFGLYAIRQNVRNNVSNSHASSFSALAREYFLDGDTSVALCFASVDKAATHNRIHLAQRFFCGCAQLFFDFLNALKLEYLSAEVRNRSGTVRVILPETVEFVSQAIVFASFHTFVVAPVGLAIGVFFSEVFELLVKTNIFALANAALVVFAEVGELVIQLSEFHVKVI